ncbi:MAG: hypothetical protein P8Y62_03990 [candidate division WOR-3 bacterium]
MSVKRDAPRIENASNELALNIPLIRGNKSAGSAIERFRPKYKTR